MRRKRKGISFMESHIVQNFWSVNSSGERNRIMLDLKANLNISGSIICKMLRDALRVIDNH